jgi:hypothetical protein
MMNQTPKQAIEELIGEQFIEWLAQYVPREMQSWPIMQKIHEASPKPEKIRKFMLQVFLVNEAFLGAREGDPGFLRFAIANLSESDDPLAESALEILEKRRTEELMGHKMEKGILHSVSRQNWIRLLKAIGVTDEEIERSEPKELTRNYIAELSEVYSTQDWQTVVGAFAASELAVQEENKVLVEFLKKNLGVVDKDVEFLVVRQSYSHILDKVAFDPPSKELVWQGVERLMEIRRDFLTGLEKYLEN